MSELISTGLWHDGERIIERRAQDVEPILEHNKALRSVGEVGSSDMRHAAKIPFAIIENYLQRHNITLAELNSSAGKHHWKAMLNDPDLAGFRIWQGRV